jgi:hypothetical protein
MDEEPLLVGQRQALLACQPPQLVRDDDFPLLERAAGVDPTSVEGALSQVAI